MLNKWTIVHFWKIIECTYLLQDQSDSFMKSGGLWVEVDYVVS